ncbi:MAG: hypothetical protein AB7F83_03265 [Lysobacterales bacterium]
MAITVAKTNIFLFIKRRILRRDHSYVVTLGEDKDPVFPDMCAVCLGPATSVAGLSHDSSSTGFARWFPLMGFLGEGHLELPLCRRHWWALRAERIWRGWLLPTAPILCLFLLGRLLGEETFEASLAAPLPWIGFFAMVGVYVWLELYRPRKFHSRIEGCRIVYEFTNRKYATVFSRENGARIEVN